MIQEDSMFKLGDLVIGSNDPGKSIYTATGAKINEGGVSVYGDEPGLNERRKAMVTSAVRSGGKLLKTHNSERTTKKIKAKKKGQPQQETAESMIDSYIRTLQEEEPSDFLTTTMKEKAPITVQFENDFGKLKVKLEDLVEHEQAFMLVFKDEDSVLFEPKTGESLWFHTENTGTHVVYYPGVTFNWPDSSKRLMILFKVPAEQE